MKRLILIAAIALGMAGCETVPTRYQAATAEQGVGYSEYRIEPGRYRVTFRGGPGAPRQQVEDYALVRAADLALADGYEWFRVIDRVMEGRADTGPHISLGVGGATFGRHSAVGVGVGQGFDLGGGPSLAITLEVVMGKGERPRGYDVYDAQALRKTLGERI